MSLAGLADQHFNARRLLTATTGARLSRLWTRSVDPDDIFRSWRATIPEAVEVVAEGQERAASDGQDYMDAALMQAGMGPAGVAVNPVGFSGFTYPTRNAPPRPLEESLEYPAFTALDGRRRGASSSRSMASGLDSLVTIGGSSVADAGRAADGAIAAAETAITGYVRQVEANACSRCIILAGRRYRSSEGFSRHPNCLCEHVPIIAGQGSPPIQDSYELFNDLSEADQDRIFTKDGAQAIRDGADIYQVVNARRGMSTTAGGSLITESGAGHLRGRARGYAQRQMDRHGVSGPRMMPEEIYKRANGNQRLIREQLERYGYIVPDARRSGVEGDPDPQYRRDSDGGINPQLSGWYGAAASRPSYGMNDYL